MREKFIKGARCAPNTSPIAALKVVNRNIWEYDREIARLRAFAPESPMGSDIAASARADAIASWRRNLIAERDRILSALPSVE